MNKALKLFKPNDLTRYKILEHISTRSRCYFFKVVEKKTNKLYTFKLLRSVNDNDQEDDHNIKKFMEEAEIWSITNSPLIVKMIGLCFNFELKNNSTAIMVLEYCFNNSLAQLIERIKSSQNNHEWNDTRKLICIYGIAAGMQYLHSKQIIHLDLRPANILLNESLHPKINDFYTSIKIGKNNESSLQKNAATIDYMAPEVVNDDYYSTAADVYSFGVTVHEILTCKKPYEGRTTNRNVKISDQIPKCYQNLISKCLATDPSYRPTFSDIVKYLRNNKKFTTESVNEEEFLQFCEFVDSAHQDKVDFEKKVEINMKPIDLSLFKREELIKKETFANVYRVVEQKTGSNFAAKINIADHDQDNQISSREINILLKLRSNSILKFIGYNENDFNNKPRMTIITEFAKNGSLDKILDNEREKMSDPKWDDTKKLITIFGIAFGMSYLHSKDILHRDLKPENIFLNELFYPKIGGFRFSKEIEYISEEDNLARTPAYMSPELIMKAINSKASDVYSFAFVVYEIVTLEVPFKDLDRYDILLKVTSGYRPEIAEDVPDCYRELIQKCWSQDPSKRPTFDSIVELLKYNPDFITNTVDQGEFIRYINYLRKCSSDLRRMNDKELLSEFLKMEQEEADAVIETNEEIFNYSDKSTERLIIDTLLSETNQQNQEEQKLIAENEEEKNKISICEEESENEEAQKLEEQEQKVITENEEKQKEFENEEEQTVITENEEEQKEFENEEEQTVITENEEEQKEFEKKEDQSENIENDEESKQNLKDGIIVSLECSDEDESEERCDEPEESSKYLIERIESCQTQKLTKSEKLKHKKSKKLRNTRQIQNNHVLNIKVESDKTEIPNDKETIEKKAEKTIQTNENAQVSKEPSSPPKNAKNSPPLKPFISHYDRSVFYQHQNSPSMQTKHVNEKVSDPIKLKVTLKDIGLEGLDSPNPSKALELQRKRKIEQENSKLSGRNQQSSQTPLSPSSRARLAPMKESNKNNPNAHNPKPVNLLSSAHKAKKSQKIIPKTSPKKKKY